MTFVVVVIVCLLLMFFLFFVFLVGGGGGGGGGWEWRGWLRFVITANSKFPSQSFGCKMGFVLRTSIIILKKKCQQLSAILLHSSSFLKMPLDE